MKTTQQPLRSCVGRATAVLLLTVMASACGESTPTMPSVPPPAPAPPPPPRRAHELVTLRLTGRVHDEGNAPVAGATVTVRGEGMTTAATATTDANGFYDTPVVLDTYYWEPLAWVSIRSAGYDDVENAAVFPDGQDTTADFLTFRRLIIPAGADMNLPISYGGSLCGFDLESPCRHVSVSAASAGTLVIETRGDRSLGTFPFGPSTYPPTDVYRKFVPVRAGEVVPFEILWVASPGSYAPGRTVTFTLATRLEP